MTSVQGVSVQGVEWARRRVLAHKILSGPALLEYFASRVELDPTLDIGSLQEEAVARGLYRYLGERYLLALDFTVACAGAAIKLDVIRSEDELASFLERASHSLAPFGHRGKAHNDLKIDARQRGLYVLIESKSAATSESWRHNLTHPGPAIAGPFHVQVPFPGLFRRPLLPKHIFSAHQFTPTQWESAEVKAKFANQLMRFLESECKETLFTHAFYNRLSMSFGHIAHYAGPNFLPDVVRDGRSTPRLHQTRSSIWRPTREEASTASVSSMRCARRSICFNVSEGTSRLPASR